MKIPEPQHTISALVDAARRAPAFQVGEVVGGREVTHAGDPAAYSARRRVAVRCTRCGSRWTMLECYLRWIRDGRVRVTGCLFCHEGLRKDQVVRDD